MFNWFKSLVGKDAEPEFTWQHINLDVELVEEIKSIYLKNLPDYRNGLPAFQKLELQIPDVNGMRVVVPGLFYSSGLNNWSYAHKDPIDQECTRSTLALNIPLINCENSRTSLYKENKLMQPSLLNEHIDGNYVSTDLKNTIELQKKNKKQLLTSYVLNRPILFNTRIFHAVENFSIKPRLAISLRFERNPTEWITK